MAGRHKQRFWGHNIFSRAFTDHISKLKAKNFSTGENLKKLQANGRRKLRLGIMLYLTCTTNFVPSFLEGECILFESCELLFRSDLNYSLWFSLFWLLVCSLNVFSALKECPISPKNSQNTKHVYSFSLVIF